MSPRPTLLIFFLAQRYFIRPVAAAGLATTGLATTGLATTGWPAAERGPAQRTGNNSGDDERAKGRQRGRA